MDSKAKKLRELFKTKSVIRIMGAHHGLGAKLIERNGFDGIWASGLEISTVHAVPDANILTMTEFFEAACAMNESTSLPVICDCDTGFGNSLNVMHMVKKYESAGLAAAVIEDKLFPKVNSFVPGRQELATIEEFMGKIEAAKSAQKGSDFMVFARVEALIAGWGLEEALRRAAAYVEAGADGIVIHSKATTPDEVYAFAQRWKLSAPLVVIPTTYYSVKAQEFSKKGFKMVIYANQGLRASIRAMNETFKLIHDTGSTEAVESSIASMKEVFEVQGMNDMKEREKKFEKKEKIQAVIPAAGPNHLRAELKAPWKDLPLCMLEAGGKTLIDRESDSLRSCGVNDIYVVSGYQGQKVKADGVTLLHNADHQKTGSAYSILSAASHFKKKCLVVYADIVFDRQIVEHLLDTPHPITIVMDRAFRSLPFRDKRLDLVIAKDPSEGAVERHLTLNTFKPVERIGRQTPKNKANYEFIGMAYFKEEGLRVLTDAWREANRKFKGKRFYEAASVEQADFNDLLQFMIDRGHPVYGMEIEHGWSEIHSLKDLERVRAHFERADSVLTVRK